MRAYMSSWSQWHTAAFVNSEKLAHCEVGVEGCIEKGGLICISTYAVSRWMCEAAGRMLGRPGIAVEAVIGWSTSCAL